MILICVFFLSTQSEANRNIEQVFIAYIDEVIQIDLMSAPYGNTFNYSIIDSDCDSVTIQAAPNLIFEYEYPFEFPDTFVGMTEYRNASTTLILISNSDSLLLFSINLITSQINLEFLVEASNITAYYNSSIQETLIVENIIYILVSTIEIVDSLEVTKNIVFYIDTTEDYYTLNELDLWDLRYMENLNMGYSDSTQLCFTAFAYNSTGLIFAYNFSNILNPILLECFLNFSLNPLGDNQIMKTLDSMIFANYLTVLQETAVIVYSKNGQYFQELYYADLSLYGELYSLTYLSRQMNTSSNSNVPNRLFSVISESGLILLEVLEKFEKGIILQYNGNGSSGLATNSQMYMPYVFSTNYNESLMLQFSYYEPTENTFFYAYSNLSALIHNPSTHGAWVVVRGYNSYYYVRQDFDGIRVYQFNLTEPSVLISSGHDCFVSLEANEMGNISHINMFLIIFESVSDINPVSGYKYIFNYELEFSIYFNNQSEVLAINMTDYISGWDLKFNVSNLTPQDNFLLEHSTPHHYNQIGTFQFELGFFKGVFVDGQVYLLNSSGILMYPLNFVEAADPLDIDFVIRDGSMYIIVLFFNEIVLYKPNLSFNSRISINFTCNFIKGISGTIICADNTRCLYIYINGVINIQEIIDGNFIIDASYYMHEDFTFDKQILLTDKGLSVITESSNQIISYNSFSAVGTILLLSRSYLYLLNPGVKVYSINDLLHVIKFIPIPGLITSAYIYEDILFLEVNDNLYIVNCLLPVLSSVVNILDTYGCILMNSYDSFLMTLCETSFNTFNFTQNSSTDTILYMNFTVSNISEVDKGYYTVQYLLLVSNSASNFHLPLTFKLFTYGISLFFNPMALTTNLNYGVDYEYGLRSAINGYNIDSVLIVDGAESFFNPINLSSKVNLYPAVYRSGTYFNQTEFIDHTTVSVDYEKLIIALTKDSLLVINYSEMDSGYVSELSLIYSISLFSLFNLPISCMSLDLVSVPNSSIVLCMSCIYNSSYTNYYNGKTVNLLLPSYYLVVVSFTVKDFSTNIIYKELPYLPTLIKPITSSRFKSSLILIDQVSIDRAYNYNNHILIINVDFFGPSNITLNLLKIVNYYTLGIDSMYAVYVDGVFDYSLELGNTLKLFVADLMYGIRFIRVYNESVSLIGSYPFSNDRIVSLSVCGSTLITLTELTNIKLYTINSETLSLLETYPASPIVEYSGTNSLISCNDYYSPQYISLYLCSDSMESFKLRIIDLKQSFINTVIGEILINKNVQNPKTLFLTNSTFTVITSSPAIIYIYYIGEPHLFFPDLDENAFNELADGKSSFTFNFKIKASNELKIIVDSQKFSITRVGPGTSYEGGIGNDYYLILLFAGILLILVSIAALLMFKTLAQNRRIIRKKRFMAVDIEMRKDPSILSFE